MLGSMSTPGRLGELELIRRIAAGRRTRHAAVRLGIGDDCAVLRVPPGHEIVVTSDFSLEGRHFRRDWHTPQSAGHRCLARGLSDIAAMGARPAAAFLSLALPHHYDLTWVDGFFAGLQALAERFGVELAGGDTGEAPGAQILADIMVVGIVPEGKALLRSGAAPGDGIFVTGTLGGAAVELEEMRAGRPPRLPGREACPQSFPEPRVSAGLLLSGLASAGMDLSDGLSTDLRHLCEASGTGAEILGEALPLATGASVRDALDGGEDYELLFTSAAEIPAELAGVNVTRIGTVTEGGEVRMDGRELRAGGWEHLR